MTQIYLISGIFGALGMTWLFPILGLVYKTSERKSERNWPPRSLEILIPAHNEESRITETLTKIQSQSVECMKRNTQSMISIRVGADACTDQTEALAAKLGVRVENYPYKNKWKTLSSLILSSSADWVALVDAETLWPDNFLRQLWDKRWNAPLVGIAPSFGEGWIWSLERHFKVLENFSGGPISVHGATVFYERMALLEALKLLGDTEWINDDVVIPLTLRAKFPDRVLAYSVAENDPHPGASQVKESSRGRITHEFKALLRRRRRMLAGNLQWITLLLPQIVKLSPLAVLIAMRRVMRVFWAYWLLFLILGLPHYFWLSVILFALLLKRETVFAAFLASLTAPWQMYRRDSVSWT